MSGAVAVAVPAGPIGGPSRSPGRRLMAGAVVVCLAAYLLGRRRPALGGPWAGGFSRVGVHRCRPGAADGARAQAERAGIDVDDVVEVVAHRVTPVPGRPGCWSRSTTATGRSSTAQRVRARRLRVSLTAVRRGDTAVPLRLEPWRGGGQRRVPADNWRGDRASHRPRRASWNGTSSSIARSRVEGIWSSRPASPGASVARTRRGRSGVRHPSGGRARRCAGREGRPRRVLYRRCPRQPGTGSAWSSPHVCSSTPCTR